MSNLTDYPAGNRIPGVTTETMVVPLPLKRVGILTVLLMEVSVPAAQSTSAQC